MRPGVSWRWRSGQTVEHPGEVNLQPRFHRRGEPGDGPESGTTVGSQRPEVPLFRRLVMPRSQSVVRWRFLLSGLGVLSACSGGMQSSHPLSAVDVKAIRALDSGYVASWLADDTAGVLATLAPDAVLMPAGLGPFIGIDAIRQFWWPEDGSRTRVIAYSARIEELNGRRGLAYVRGSGTFTFTYQKDTLSTTQTNHYMSLTVVAPDAKGAWRIIQRMWGPLGR